MREFMAIAKALAEENRSRVLMLLREGELCVCQIIELLGLTPSTVSKHLSILHGAGLIESRKDGRWIYYRLPGRDGSACARAAVRWVTGSLENARRVLKDANRGKVVRKMDAKRFCRNYCT